MRIQIIYEKDDDRYDVHKGVDIQKLIQDNYPDILVEPVDEGDLH